MLGPSAFSCDVLSSSAPLVQILHDISFEWSQAYQRKGKPVVRATARAALCSFDGSPCPIFARPIALLAGYLAHNGVLRFHTVGEATSTAVRDLSTRLVAMGAVADAANYDVLLLPVGTSPPRCAPQLVVVLSDAPLPSPRWQSSAHDAYACAGFGNASSFFFPNDSDDTAAEAIAAAGSKRSRRARRSSNPPATHTAAVFWRAGGCTPPVYDLARPLAAGSGSLTAAEAASAARAVASGIPFSEWFACSTLEVLRPLARNLFRLPRRFGKSVWHTCMRERSPCFWFTGAHARGEHFVTQVLSSPDILLTRLTAARTSALAALASTGAAPWADLVVLDPTAGEGNYTQHLPDGMGRTPPWVLVSKHGWRAVLAEPIPSAYTWLAANFEPYVRSGRAVLLADGVGVEQVCGEIDHGSDRQ